MNLNLAKRIQSLLDAALQMPQPEARHLDPAELMPFERAELGLDERAWQVTQPGEQ